MKPLYYLTALAVSGLFSLSAAAADTADCTIPSEKEVTALFDRWNDSLKTGDAHKVAENYASDATLLPTLSGRIRLTNEERIDYFEHFLARKPTGHIVDRQIYRGCNYAVDTGNYTFSFADKTQAEARYTYTYTLENGDWKISSHHSSVKPHS